MILEQVAVYVLIPLLPLLASVTLALSGRRFEGLGHRIAVPAIGASFLLSVVAFLEIASGGGPIRIPLYRLLESGNLVIDLGLYVDQLTVLLLLLVTGVSGIVHVYASRYMIGDSRHSRFFALTALFTFAMIVLVMSSNLLLTYVFWEVMGLCSYFLISHFAQRRSAYRAATRAFLVNAVADVGLGFGVILTFRTFGTLDIPEILASAEILGSRTMTPLAWAGLDFPVQAATLITLCLLVGAMGKSAQVPFHAWLPLAMEAPTPVSALIHAATMVNAGPFLLVRLSPLVVLSPAAMVVIALVGGTTALFAALVSLTQADIKRVLAFSTISQLGFMIFACGVGAFVVAIFHLLAHGFLKAFLFLSTGNVLAATHPKHVASAEHDSSATKPLFAGALLLSAIPPVVIFAGPYERLWLASDFAAAGVAFWVLGLGTVLFTAMYLFRTIVSLFQHGPPAGRGGRESSSVRPRLLSPSHLGGVLTAAVISAGILFALWTWMTGFLSPAVGRFSPAAAQTAGGTAFFPWILVPVAVAIAGWGWAYARYRKPGASFVSSSSRWYVFFLKKGYFDEIYDVVVVEPTIRLARWLWRTVDAGGIDRLVVGVGTHMEGFSRWLWRRVDAGGIDRLVVGMGTLTVSFSRWLWRFLDMGGIARVNERFGDRVHTTGRALQTVEPRTLQQNLLVMVFWLVAAIGFYYWIV